MVIPCKQNVRLNPHPNIQMKYAFCSRSRTGQPFAKILWKGMKEKLGSSCWTLFDHMNAQRDTKRKFADNERQKSPDITDDLENTFYFYFYSQKGQLFAFFHKTIFRASTLKTINPFRKHFLELLLSLIRFSLQITILSTFTLTKNNC